MGRPTCFLIFHPILIRAVRKIRSESFCCACSLYLQPNVFPEICARRVPDSAFHRIPYAGSRICVLRLPVPAGLYHEFPLYCPHLAASSDRPWNEPGLPDRKTPEDSPEDFFVFCRHCLGFFSRTLSSDTLIFTQSGNNGALALKPSGFWRTDCSIAKAQKIPGQWS
jgi:hypothetical protein